MDTSSGPGSPALMAAGLLLLVGLFFAARIALGPFLLLIALLVLLWPSRGAAWARSLLIVGVLFFGVWFVWMTRTVLTPFVLGLLLAYLLDPIVDRMEKRVPRTAAIAALLLLSLSALGLVLLIVVPVVVDQIGTLSRDLPGHVTTVRTWLQETFIPLVQRLGFEVDVQGLPGQILGEGGEAGISLQRLLGGALQLTSGLYSALAQALNILLIPVVAFYLLKDYDQMVTWVYGLVPPHRREAASEVARDLGGVLGNFVRGQFAVSLTIGVLYAVGLSIAGIDYAVLLGLAAAVLSLIPYAGSILTFVLAALIALLGPAPLGGLLRTAIVYAVIQLLDANLITPRIMGGRMGLHPVLVMLAVLVFASLMGLLGLLIAVPVTAVLKVLADRGIARWRASAAYASDAPPTGDGG